MRTAAAELAAERERAQQATEQRDAAQARLDALNAEEHALVTSAAWSSVAEVETLRELAQTQARAATAARRHADDAAAAASALEAELITARAATAERRDRASDELDSLLALGAEAGLERRTATLADQLRTGALAADTWSLLLRELATDWRDVLHRHRELMRELATGRRRSRARPRRGARSGGAPRAGGGEADRLRAAARGSSRRAQHRVRALAIGARAA